MKPLASFTYIKSNKKKVLPSFVCTIASVFLIYIFGLLLYGSFDDFNKLSINLLDKCTFIYSNSIDKPLSDNINDNINDDENIKDVVPMLGMNNSFNYSAVFGNSGSSSFIMYSEDVERGLKNLDIELVQGNIPENNKSEIILPEEMAKQYKLKIGDYIDNDTSKSIKVNKTYKLVGITRGDSWLPIVCDVGDITREDALKYGMILFFKNNNNKDINKKLSNLNDKNIVIQEYETTKDMMGQAIASMNFLYVSLDIVIIFVLSVSLSNLNYIVFLNRRNEFAVLKTIGTSKYKLKGKLFKENLLVCFAGFIFGIVLTMGITEILNIVVWEPNGQHIAIFRISSILVALIVPISVSLLSMASSLREFNKLDIDSLNS
ncbi:MAG: ABC transporter permease [Clostridiaceae bacterium]